MGAEGGGGYGWRCGRGEERHGRRRGHGGGCEFNIGHGQARARRWARVVEVWTAVGGKRGRFIFCKKK